MLLKNSLPIAARSLAFGSAAAAQDHAGMMGYALAKDGGTLVTMADISQPGEVETYALETPFRRDPHEKTSTKAAVEGPRGGGPVLCRMRSSEPSRSIVVLAKFNLEGDF